MGWKHLLAYITGSVDQELLLRNEYLMTRNRILRNQIKESSWPTPLLCKRTFPAAGRSCRSVASTIRGTARRSVTSAMSARARPGVVKLISHAAVAFTPLDGNSLTAIFVGTSPLVQLPRRMAYSPHEPTTRNQPL
jgi:hypothetical protein